MQIFTSNTILECLVDHYLFYNCNSVTGKTGYSIELKLPPFCKGGVNQCAFLLFYLVVDNEGACLLMQSGCDIF